MNARVLMAFGLAALLVSACDEKVEVPDGGTDDIDGAVDAGDALDSGPATLGTSTTVVLPTGGRRAEMALSRLRRPATETARRVATTASPARSTS